MYYQIYWLIYHKLTLSAYNTILYGCFLEQESVTDAHKLLDIMSLLGVHPDETTFGYLVYLYATKELEHKMIELQDLVSRFNLPNKSIFISNLLRRLYESFWTKTSL